VLPYRGGNCDFQECRYTTEKENLQHVLGVRVVKDSDAGAANVTGPAGGWPSLSWGGGLGCETCCGLIGPEDNSAIRWRRHRREGGPTSNKSGGPRRTDP
jgi:hypothetical protein